MLLNGAVRFMLLILSDLHLNDGTTGETLSPEAFALFADRLKELAITASWRSDGAYRPIERIDLVLLGDVFDLLHSNRWQATAGVRPWDDPQSPGLIDQVTRITSDILSQNQESLATLRALSGEGAITIPPMLRAARPASDADDQPVTTRTHYMVGNHDWFYHLPGEAYDALRQKLVEQMGLANRPDRPFPHDIIESDELLQTMRRHKVTARHGDAFDPLCFEGDRDLAGLNDAITVDLASRFVIEVEQRLGHELPDATILAFREIDHFRPLLLIPAWIECLLERTCPQPAVRKRVKQLWDRLAEELLSSRLVCDRDASSSANLVDGLSRALRFSKRRSTGWTAATAEWLRTLRGADNDSLAVHALTEPDFRTRRAKHVVYGHTHLAEIVPLDASHAEGYVLDQVYFNAGTWRRIYRLASFAPAGHEFIAADVFSYLAFFQGDERKGRSFETWTGTLGHTPAERKIHRIDAGRSVLAGHMAPSAPHLAMLLGNRVGATSRRSS
jgi:UDP-2,3-diacylglucosamine pyrophosphatase LpxH